MKNKWLAAILNVVPGLGYLYAGIRTPFALILLLSTALMFLGSFMVPIEDLEALDAIPYTIWDFLPGITFVIAFMVDAYLEVANTQKPKSTK